MIKVSPKFLEAAEYAIGKEFSNFNLANKLDTIDIKDIDIIFENFGNRIVNLELVNVSPYRHIELRTLWSMEKYCKIEEEYTLKSLKLSRYQNTGKYLHKIYPIITNITTLHLDTIELCDYIIAFLNYCVSAEA